MPEITVMATPSNSKRISEKEALLLARHIKELVKIEKFLTSLSSEHYVFVTEYVFFKTFKMASAPLLLLKADKSKYLSL